MCPIIDIVTELITAQSYMFYVAAKFTNVLQDVACNVNTFAPP